MSYKIREKLRHAMRLIDTQAYLEAVPMLQMIRDEAADLGVPLEFINFQLAIAADNCGRLDLAVDAIVAATSRDPVNPFFDTSRTIISKHVFTELLSCRDEDVLRLVGMLERLGDVPVEARLRHAHWLILQGEVEAAARLVYAAAIVQPRGDAVTSLENLLSAVLGPLWSADMDRRLGFKTMTRSSTRPADQKN